MSFKKKFPSLFQFFAGYFPDADLDNLTDEAVVANFINDCNKSEVSMKESEVVKKNCHY